MTPLRQRMIENLQLKGYSNSTQTLYVNAVLVTKHLKRQTELVGIIWFLGFSQILSGIIGISPLFLVTVFTGVLEIINLERMAIKPKASESLMVS